MGSFYDECVRRSLHETGRADFGATAIGNIPTLSDVKGLTDNYDRWIPILRERFHRIESAWQVASPEEEADFESDLKGLERRYSAAHLLAIGDKGLDVALLPVLLPAATLSAAYSWIKGGSFSATQGGIPASTVYKAYMAAIRQGSLTQGDGAPEQKGDYTDLARRLTEEETALEIPAPSTLTEPSITQPDAKLDQGLNVLRDTNNVPKPPEMLYWAKLIAAGVAASLLVQGIQTAVKVKRELRESHE